jgi:hypothetical protein
VTSGGLLTERPTPVAAPRASRSRERWALAAGALALVLAALARLEPLAGDALSADVGIQFHLAGEVARGALPLLDFEHGWNVGGWWHVALFHVLAGGSATGWAFLFGTVGGRLLAGLVLLLVGRRAGLTAPWLLALTGALLVVGDVPNAKYALPALWLAALRPWAEPARADVAVRFVLAALMVVTHVELAVMLAAGTALYDVLGARGLGATRRALRVGALAVGAAGAFAVQVWLFARAGVPAEETVRFFVLDRAAVAEGATAFTSTLVVPDSVRAAVFAPGLVLAFVPLVWRRLGPTVRCTAALNLGLGLIALRKPDEGHLGAATALLPLLLVLAARDLAADPPRRPRWTATAPLHLLAGAAVLAGGLVLAVEARSVLALAALGALGATGAVAGRRDLPWASAGALAAAAVLVVVGVVGRVGADLQGPDDRLLDRVIADDVRADVDRCLGADRRAWVVTEPLELYDLLGLQNPTPWYLFWPGFAQESDRVLARIDDGTLPAVLQVGPWPPSLAAVAPTVEDRYELCLDTEVVPPAGTGLLPRGVRLWVQR